MSFDLYSAIPWNGDTSNALMCLYCPERYAFSSPAQSVQTRRPDHATNQAVSS